MLDQEKNLHESLRQSLNRCWILILFVEICLSNAISDKVFINEEDKFRNTYFWIGFFTKTIVP